MKCKNCDFFLSSGFGMIGGVCRLSGEFKTKNSGCDGKEGTEDGQP